MLSASSRIQLSAFAGAAPLQQRFLRTKAPQPPPFPTTATCPSPTCACAPTPELPEGFEIDHKAPLNGLISSYAQHVLVCTGKDDWPSKIEEDNSGDNLAADLKELLGRGGNYNDVCFGLDLRTWRSLDYRETAILTHVHPPPT